MLNSLVYSLQFIKTAGGKDFAKKDNRKRDANLLQKMTQIRSKSVVKPLEWYLRRALLTRKDWVVMTKILDILYITGKLLVSRLQISSEKRQRFMLNRSKCLLIKHLYHTVAHH